LALAATEKVEVLLVDDGSTDDSVGVATMHLRGMRWGRVLSLPHNLGKGAAVRAGVLEASAPVIVYMDADLAADMDGLGRLLAALDSADIAVGSRAVADSEVIDSTTSRAMMGRTWNAMVRLATGLSLHDTQCGFKAFHAPVARMLFGDARINGFAFDVEILVLAQRRGIRIAEVPVRWRAVDGTSVRPFLDPLVMTRDLARIKLRTFRPAIGSALKGAPAIPVLSPADEEPA
jgi:dolichyl-phosphate beta-glucosyltransferase